MNINIENFILRFIYKFFTILVLFIQIFIIMFVLKHFTNVTQKDSYIITAIIVIVDQFLDIKANLAEQRGWFDLDIFNHRK